MKIALTSDIHYGFNGKTDRIFKKFVKELALNKDIELLIVAGDLASSKQRNLETAFDILRNAITIPIVFVRGNHDFWAGFDKKIDVQFTSLKQIYDYQNGIFKWYNIHHLDTPFIYKDAQFCGFDGWYGSLYPQTNDEYWIPKESGYGPSSMQYLYHKNVKDFDNVKSIDTSKFNKNILITHINITPYKGMTKDPWMMAGPKYFYDEIKNKFDVLCYGHTHLETDHFDKDGNIYVYNSGSDYNKPKYIIIDL